MNNFSQKSSVFYKNKTAIWRFNYSIAHGSVYSYVPLSSVNDTPAGAYIMHDPDGLDTRHDSAVPTAIVPLGHDVAMVIYGASTAM